MTLTISRHARQYVDYKPATEPSLTGWEASFDNGKTWVLGTPLTGDDDGWFRWLVAGSSADPGAAVVSLAPGTTRVILRATDTPEIVIIRPDPIRTE